MAEVYGVPRIERPFWVAQQVEVAAFDGLARRIRAGMRQHQIGAKIKRRVRRKFHGVWNERPECGFAELTLQWSVMGISASAMVYLPITPRSWVALAIEITAALAFFVIGQFARRRNRSRTPSARVRLQRAEVIFIALAAPIAYCLACFSVVHDIMGLSTGNLSHGYWIGLCVSLYSLTIPAELVREMKLVAMLDAQKYSGQAIA
jgi:hypothetical protein